MKTPKITSTSNPHLREVISRLKTPFDAAERIFLIEGPHLIEMALDRSARLGEVFFTNRYSLSASGPGLLVRLCAAGIKLIEVTDRILDKIADTEAPQGIVATVEVKTRKLNDIMPGSTPLLVVLDRIQDPGNLGSIIRTADAAGADAVILLCGTCDPYMGKVVRASAGSIFNVPVIRTDAAVLLSFLSDSGIRLACSSLDATASLYETDLRGPLAVVFGNEGAGHPDSKLTIPIT